MRRVSTNLVPTLLGEEVGLQEVAGASTRTAPHLVEKQDSPAADEDRIGRILVVEDSPTQAQQLQCILEAAGYEVEVAPDGETGFDLFNASAFDLIMSDILMPGLSGYELCRKIKDDPAIPNGDAASLQVEQIQEWVTVPEPRKSLAW